MSTIVTRAAKGSALTHNEVDANFVNLNTDKVEKAGTDPVSISVNSTSNALRITQTGTGNAFVVEDSGSPDATPFVIDATGAITTYENITQQSDSDKRIYLRRAASFGSGGNSINFERARNTVIAPQVVTSADLLGNVLFSGHDGTAYMQAASITAAVDGTPGTNDMPGRLVFSTTADGASAPTERMRIDSAGNIGIGAAALTGFRLRVDGNITGSSGVARVIQASGAVQSDVGTNAVSVRSIVGTQAAAFTLPSLTHFEAVQGSIGAGSTVTNQYGYTAANNLTGATNNYGFYGNIAAGTGRYNFYANGTAANYFAGNVQFAAGSAASPALTNISDTNTGIFFPASDTIAFAEGGVETMRLDNAGNLKFNSGYGSVATAYGCRAWVNFNGTGTVAIRASGNVSSITDNATGDYTVNLTSGMPDTNGTVAGSAVEGVGTFTGGQRVVNASFASVSAIRIGVTYQNGGVADCPFVGISIFR